MAFAYSGTSSSVAFSGQNIIRMNPLGSGPKEEQFKYWDKNYDEKSIAPDRKRSHKRRRKVKPSNEAR